jgi:hypothetical protein
MCCHLTQSRIVHGERNACSTQGLLRQSHNLVRCFVKWKDARWVLDCCRDPERCRVATQLARDANLVGRARGKQRRRKPQPSHRRCLPPTQLSRVDTTQHSSNSSTTHQRLAWLWMSSKRGSGVTCHRTRHALPLRVPKCKTFAY